MNRTDLQKLANTRIREAKILFEAGEYGGAYYLAGYAVECALKACFAKTVKRYDFPDRSGTGKIFTHNLPDLTRLANLDGHLATARKTNVSLEASWQLVRGWTEESRYSTRTRDEAEQMIDAISGRKDGVLSWIKQHW